MLGSDQKRTRQDDRDLPLPVQSVAQRVLATQRQAGNAATARMLQRLAYTDAPATWGNVAVKRSSEGVEGVYFVGPTRDIVVKPVRSTGTVEYANRFMGAIGFTAPKSVRYAMNDAGTAGVITQLIVSKKGTQGVPDDVDTKLPTYAAYMVMEKVTGKSIQTLTDQEALEYLRNQDALKATGRLMLADAFLGNSDRLVGGKANLGNFFYQVAGAVNPGVVNTIDNESKFETGSVRKTKAGKKRLDGDLGNKAHLIKELATPQGRLPWIKQMLARFAGAHQNNAQATAELTNNRQAIEALIDRGIQDALTDLAQFLKTNMDLVRAVAVGYDTESAASRDLTAAKGAAKFVRAIAGGMDPDKATDRLIAYVEYKGKRDKTISGFKWVTKLASKPNF